LREHHLEAAPKQRVVVDHQDPDRLPRGNPHHGRRRHRLGEAGRRLVVIGN